MTIWSARTRKTESKISYEPAKEKTNSNKVKSPVERKSKFTNRGSKENDKKRKKFMCKNFGEDKKEQLKNMIKRKTKRNKCV